jgi:hypothetical protein
MSVWSQRSPPTALFSAPPALLRRACLCCLLAPQRAALARPLPRSPARMRTRHGVPRPLPPRRAPTAPLMPAVFSADAAAARASRPRAYNTRAVCPASAPPSCATTPGGLSSPFRCRPAAGRGFVRGPASIGPPGPQSCLRTCGQARPHCRTASGDGGPRVCLPGPKRPHITRRRPSPLLSKPSQWR